MPAKILICSIGTDIIDQSQTLDLSSSLLKVGYRQAECRARQARSKVQNIGAAKFGAKAPTFALARTGGSLRGDVPPFEAERF